MKELLEKLPAAKEGKILADKMIDNCGTPPGDNHHHHDNQLLVIVMMMTLSLRGHWHPELEEVYHQDQIQVRYKA